MDNMIAWSKSFQKHVSSKCGRFEIYPITGGFQLLDEASGQVVDGKTHKELKCEAAKILLVTL